MSAPELSKSQEIIQEKKSEQEPKFQQYCWPDSVRNYIYSSLFVGLFLSTFGLAMVVATIQLYDASISNGVDSGWMAIGLIIHVIGLMAAVCSALYVYSLVRQVCFTMDSVIISQVGRKDITLPYNEYNFQWVFDSRPSGSIRLLMLEKHKGCTIPHAPQWVHDAFQEIGRIQEEEGWYEPEQG